MEEAITDKNFQREVIERLTRIENLLHETARNDHGATKKQQPER